MTRQNISSSLSFSFEDRMIVNIIKKEQRYIIMDKDNVGCAAQIEEGPINLIEDTLLISIAIDSCFPRTFPSISSNPIIICSSSNWLQLNKDSFACIQLSLSVLGFPLIYQLKNLIVKMLIFS